MAKWKKLCSLLLLVCSLSLCALAAGCDGALSGQEGGGSVENGAGGGETPEVNPSENPEQTEKVSVTFLTAEGEVFLTESVEKNQAVRAPSTPTRSGYSFVEWQANGQAFDFATPIAENLSLYAEWSPVEYTITYENVRGVAHENPVKYTVESQTVTFAPLQMENLTFLGWDISSVEGGSVGDKTVTARWGVTVTFDTVGGTQIAPVTVEEGGVLTPPDNPTKPNKETDKIVIDYPFSCWKLNGEKFDFSTKLTENITLTAYYETYVQLK